MTSTATPRVKIMIVDDDAVVLETTRERLEGAGYEVSSRSSSLGTTAAVLREMPDFMLLDVNMPGLRGDAVAELVSGWRGASRSPRIILHSSSSKEALIALANQCGAIGVIEKTGDAQKFLLELAECIESVD